MPDTWINRLVVSGLAADVSTFQQRAASTAGDGPTALSFEQLHMLLPEHARLGLDDPRDGWSDWEPNADHVGPPAEEARQEPGMIDLAYGFSMARYAPDELLIRASVLFPTVCFVLGWVAPSGDEHMSRFIHNGETLVYEATDELVEQLRTEVYRRYGFSYADAPIMDDPNGLWADIEGDWAVLDAVVKHWDDAVRTTLERRVATVSKPE